MNKNKYWLARISIWFSFSVLFVIGYWILFPFKALELKNIKLSSLTVNRGEHIIISADYCKYIDKQADLFVSFTDGVIYNTPPQVVNLDKGCGTTNLSIYIPKALPTGIYTLRGVFKYKVNPIKTLEVTYLTEQFTIVK